MPAQPLLVITYEQDMVDGPGPRTIIEVPQCAEAGNAGIELIGAFPWSTKDTEMPIAQCDLLRHEVCVAEMNIEGAETEALIATFLAGEVGQDRLLSVGMGDIGVAVPCIGMQMTMTTFQFREEILEMYRRFR